MALQLYCLQNHYTFSLNKQTSDKIKILASPAAGGMKGQGV
jgi:hypothetical protein